MRNLTLAALVLALTSPAFASAKKEKIEMAKGAKTSLVDALGKATAKTPGKAVEAELKKKGGKVVWEVEVLGEDGKMSEVDVSTETGEVADMEAKK